ncbi:uncharacterized protein LOC124264594 [Haliotis rubra]|uniref:uncharacterized protein LOC124264594 n=1 Tax=Haliotis rubra TaxID=36100 RepID=UPI001EE5C999|nr:uncharacterized protein LOC124264594 [Haliotis rubra]
MIAVRNCQTDIVRGERSKTNQHKMNTLTVWVAVGLVCTLMCHTLAVETIDCPPISSNRCRRPASTTTLDGDEYCCPRKFPNLSSGLKNVNGVVTVSCKCFQDLDA